MKKDMTDLKKLVLNIMEKEEQVISADQEQIIRDLYSSEEIGFSSRNNLLSQFQFRILTKDKSRTPRR